MLFIWLLSPVFLHIQAQPAANSPEATAFMQSTPLIKGKGVYSAEKGMLTIREAYAEYGDPSWSDYEIHFSARTPATEKEVQIWSGFRAYNREDRYMLGLRGGEQNSLYLSRMGYMGTDELLANRMLDFKPQTGEWFHFRIVVKGNRIQVYLNNEQWPRIDVRDVNSSLAPSGRVYLGGGWVKTEYKALSITAAPKQLPASVKEYAVLTTAADKEKKRLLQRKTYRPLEIGQLAAGRTKISLDGNWLFMPGYELNDQQQAVSPSSGDRQWHVMHVPDFWNPIRIWLHGERSGVHPKGVSDIYYQQETDRCEAYTFDYKKTNLAWYRQWLQLPDNINEKQTELVFDAISKVAEVWINGKKAGAHTGMFGELRIDGKGFFKPGKNLVTVKVVRDFIRDIQDAAKVVDVAVSVEVTNRMLKDLAHGFYGDDPAGIWQPVSLIITDPLKVQDVFIQPGLNGAKFDVTVGNHSGERKSFSISTDIVDRQTKALLYHGEALQGSAVNSGEEHSFSYSVNGLQPKPWSPQSPHLYDFIFRIRENGVERDTLTISSGFRTFESRDGFLWLNGSRYWLRGGNHTPFALAPNDRQLADSFFQLMKRGNLDVTRTHTSPWNELWMDAADSNGIGVSFEGSWPWLMLGPSMPEQRLIELWADEFLALLKKYRNHPSLLIWTVNNEMKFYDNDPDPERAKLKMRIISEVVKRMRKVDPSRPIVFDSNYRRKTKKFGEAFFTEIDDGDIDDIHAYINWYDHSLFNQFKGEFQLQNKNPGRPLISQEMSTGYPNNETGHATRFYTLVHQNPASLIGNLAYENADPRYFLQTQSFITGELAEALRRSNPDAAGIIHFALLTWFRHVYNAKEIEPYPTYYAIRRALSPVLVSAEIWGRHFYAGNRLPLRVCIVNDQENGSMLPASELRWKLVDDKGSVIVSGQLNVPAVKHYGREWLSSSITLPANLPADRINAKLVLELSGGNQLITSNEYDLLLANLQWTRLPAARQKKIVLADLNHSKAILDHLGVESQAFPTVRDAVAASADLYVFAGLDTAQNCSLQDVQAIRALMATGKKLLFLHSESAAKAAFPQYISGWLTDNEADIANIEIPESPLFNGIAPLELRYFNNEKSELPAVCDRYLTINRSEHTEGLVSHIRIHGYINGDMSQRTKFMETIKGFPVVQIRDKGEAIISTMLHEKALTDPVAGRLLANMIALQLGEENIH